MSLLLQFYLGSRNFDIHYRFGLMAIKHLFFAFLPLVCDFTKTEFFREIANTGTIPFFKSFFRIPAAPDGKKNCALFDLEHTIINGPEDIKLLFGFEDLSKPRNVNPHRTCVPKSSIVSDVLVMVDDIVKKLEERYDTRNESPSKEQFQSLVAVW
uniref:AlNc14C98G5956 protein n=1 Tax=Albugo laibachii Nc14 TaxID=890382 RepID=F0WH91_9STRA|nr:AlNc14C98G5956 [Albugo laibachii Nc14]|eukprot:CCA20606.1 AlNc14C98G5956 [Albugo laibachii Nc14]